MNQISLSQLRQTCLLLTMTALGLLCALPAKAQMMRKVGLDELLSQSDYVFIATCTKKEVTFKNGNIVSHYQLKPSKVIKGNLKLDAKTGEVSVEELGGELSKPLPIAQMLPGMANLAEGQDVLLFSSYGKDYSQEPMMANRLTSLSPQSLRIVGSNIGYYTIFSHPETGIKLVKKGELINPPGLNGAPVLQLTKKLEAQRAKALAAAGLDATASRDAVMKAIGEQHKQLQDVEKVASVIARNIDTKAAADRTERDKEAVSDASWANNIYEYESLDAVVRRLERLVEQSENAK